MILNLKKFLYYSRISSYHMGKKTQIPKNWCDRNILITTCISDGRFLILHHAFISAVSSMWSNGSFRSIGTYTSGPWWLFPHSYTMLFKALFWYVWEITCQNVTSTLKKPGKRCVTILICCWWFSPRLFTLIWCNKMHQNFYV